ncbi:MAG: SUMF1/EgtB/PvdO family nonheme iron enzyme [Burkholderiales bacterium]
MHTPRMQLAPHCNGVLLLLLLVAALAWPSTGHAQTRRVALLIGNADYKPDRLTNPPNDVREMEAALKAVGFGDVRTVLNANQSAMKRAVRDFGDMAQGADIALIYYSGHGTQSRGENYLIPVGATIDREADYEVEAISANAVLRQIADARPRAAIVILDACRDNPVATVKGGSKGLARMEAPTRTMIAFATAPNTTASDSGVYARVLASQIRKPGLELLDVFRNTTDEVLRQSQGRQEPRISEVSITERIYLAGQKPVEVAIAQPQPNPQPLPAKGELAARGRVFRDCPDCPEMVVVVAGNFLMGSPSTEGERRNNEGPQRSVTIARNFALGRNEVTVADFRRFLQAENYATDAERNVGNRGCIVLEVRQQKFVWTPELSWRNPGHEQTDRHPVVCVSWNDAQAYLQWLSRQAGQTYRLPSEAEWEYAARAGSGSSRPWGDDLKEACRNANVADQTKHPKFGTSWVKSSHDCNDGHWYTAPVGSYAANRFELNDMIGNVWEWTQDCYDEKAYAGKTPNDGRPYEVAGCAERVLRGGSWGNEPQYARSAVRVSQPSTARGDGIGLRVARTMP